LRLWVERLRQRIPDLLPPVLGGLLILATVLRQLIFSPGYVIYRDSFPGQLYYPYLWHPQGSFLAIENYKFVTFTGIFLPLRALGLDVYEKAVLFSVMIIAYLAFYMAIYRLLGYVKGDSFSRRVRHLASFSAALIYVTNPVAANTFFDFSLFVGYAFAPLTLTFFMEMLEGRRRYVPAVFTVAMLWWLSAVKAHWIVFGALLLIPPLVTYTIWHWRSLGRKRLSRNLFATGGILGVYLLLAAYWLIPFLLASQERFVGSYAPITYESIAYLNNTPLRDTVRLLGILNVWPQVAFEPPSSLLSLPWILASWVIPAMVGGAVIWFRKQWQTWVLLFFAVGGIFLAKGIAPPFKDLYNWLVFSNLIPASFQWLFRIASKWSIFTSLGYSGLIALAIAELISRVRRHPWSFQRSRNACLALLVCVIGILLFEWPSFTGDFNGALDPVPLPTPLVKANQWLAQQPGDYKVNWMPVTNGRELSWNKRPSGDLYTSLSSIPTIGTNWNRHPVLYYSYLYEELSKGQLTKFGQLLSILNTRFVAYHDDVITSHIHEGVEPVSVLIEGGEKDLSVKLAAQEDMDLAWQDGFMSVYQSEETSAPLFVPQHVFLSTGDLSQLASISALEGFQLVNNAVIFDSSRNTNPFQIPVDGLLLDRDAANNLLMSRVPAGKFVSVANNTLHSSLNETWSRYDIYQFDWQAVLRTFGLDVWGFDYGQGMAAFYGSSQAGQAAISVPFHVSGSGRYHLWIRTLRSPGGGELLIKMDQQFLANLSCKSAIVGFTWVDAGVVELFGNEHQVTLEGQSGLVAVNTMTLLSEEEMAKWQEESQGLANQYPNIYLLEAERDFDTAGAKVSSENGLFSSGRAIEMAYHTTISTTVNVATSGDYTVAARIFPTTSTTTSTLRITLGATLLSLVPQKDQTGWIEAGRVHLEKGPLAILVSASDPCAFDALWLGKGKTPDALATNTQAPVEISYEKIDPTRYRVRVRAEHPFVLALAESYDPLWEASGPDQRVSSVPLYGVINAFYLNKTGTYEIIVQYQAQQWARFGTLLSSIIVVAIGLIAVLYQRLRSK
jgi:hypothetical protein